MKQYVSRGCRNIAKILFTFPD